jgi:hypothetical protein
MLCIHIPPYNEIVMMVLEIVVTLCADRALLIQPVGVLPATVSLVSCHFHEKRMPVWERGS